MKKMYLIRYKNIEINELRCGKNIDKSLFGFTQ